MLFRSATSVALLACAASAAANPKPYKLAAMALPGMSLVRRDTNGYQPEETFCGEGSTCSEACGSGYTSCPSNDAAIHCFNPEAAQSCCTDGTGNSCEADYYCTHDTQLQTWCCPEAMDLVECAAAFGVQGGLESAETTTAEITTTATSVEPLPTSTTSISTTSISTTSISTTSISTTTTSISTPSTTSIFSTSTTSETPTSTSTPISSTTSSCVSTSSYVWTTSANGTVTATWTPSASGSPPPGQTTSIEPAPTSAASASGLSLALILAVASFVALF